jgi:hypothetical protein
MPPVSVRKFDGSVAGYLRRLITWTTTGVSIFHTFGYIFMMLHQVRFGVCRRIAV